MSVSGQNLVLIACLIVTAALADETSTQGYQAAREAPAKNSWVKNHARSWPFPALSADVVTVKAKNSTKTTTPPSTAPELRTSSSSSTTSTAKRGSPLSKSDYFKELTSAISQVANYENARARESSQRHYTAPYTGPRIVDIVMPDSARISRKSKGHSSADRYAAQESGVRNSFYYEPVMKKNDKFDNRPSDKNRRFDYDYDSREVDANPHSDRRDDQWDDWDDYHYDQHKYYDHKHYHKKDHDYLLPLLLLILAPLAISSFLMPVTATLMTNSMYVAGAQGAIYQGRKRRSVDERTQHRDLLIKLATLLEKAMARFESLDSEPQVDIGKAKEQ